MLISANMIESIVVVFFMDKAFLYVDPKMDGQVTLWVTWLAGEKDRLL